MCRTILMIGVFLVVGFQVIAQSNEKILFSHNDDLWIMSPDGSEPVNLTNTPEIEHSATISADGSKLAFFGLRREYTDPLPIWVMDIDGRNRRQLDATLSSDTNEAPAISPTGDQIAFARLASQEDVGWDIVLINIDGTNLRLLELPGSERGRPSWSPTGDKILFISGHESSNTDMWIVNSDGSNPIRLTNNPAPVDEPVWSPDGTKIAYISIQGVEVNIFVMNADGSNPTQLTDLPTQDFLPCWSPDSSQIGFTSTRDGDLALYIINSDGTNQQRASGLAKNCLGWYSTATATQIRSRSWGVLKQER